MEVGGEDRNEYIFTDCTDLSLSDRPQTHALFGLAIESVELTYRGGGAPTLGWEPIVMGKTSNGRALDGKGKLNNRAGVSLH